MELLIQPIANGSFLRKSLLIIYVLTGIIFLQNPPWFLWDSAYLLMSFLILVLFFLCYDRLINLQHLYVKKLPLIMVLVIFFIFYSFLQGVRFSSFVTILAFLLLFVISDEEKIETLKLVTSTLTVIISVSLFAWLFHNNVYSLPMYGYLSYGEGKGDAGLTVLKNYFLFVEYENDFSNRFYSIFDEPGVLGTLAAFVLFANRYNFKSKSNVIIFLGGIFTFSLAFVFITIMGLLLVNVKKISSLFKAIFILLFVLFLTFLLLKDNETFKLVLLGRILNIDEAGINSRTSDLLNSYYDSFITSFDVVLGKGTAFFAKNPDLLSGQGYKMFVIEYGLFGCLLVLLMYVSMFKKLHKMVYFLLGIYFISFLQRPFLFTP